MNLDVILDSFRNKWEIPSPLPLACFRTNTMEATTEKQGERGKEVREGAKITKETTKKREGKENLS